LPAAANRRRTASGGAREKLVFEYFATSFAVQWMQDIKASLKELGQQYNFEVRTGDAGRKIETQLSQVDAAIAQGIDGAFLFVVDEGSAPAVVSKFDEAKIPVIGETLKLKDGSGKVIAPYVELDAEGVGGNCGK
jgi:L-arabinose transport system substrate-binding protein